jgi:hypothetical protein
LIALKGQAIFEFIIAAVLFFGIIFYVINYLNIQMSTFSNDYYVNELENKAVQITELLMHTPGVWHMDGTPDVVGLSDSWPVLNISKVNMLDEYCRNNYILLMEKLDMETTFPYSRRLMKAAIEVNETASNRNILDCGVEPENITVAKITRYCVTEAGNTARMDVAVWM